MQGRFGLSPGLPAPVGDARQAAHVALVEIHPGGRLASRGELHRALHPHVLLRLELARWQALVGIEPYERARRIVERVGLAVHPLAALAALDGARVPAQPVEGACYAA